MLPTAVALLSLLSPAVAGALPNKRQESTTAACFTDLGSVSIDNVPTSTATVTSTDEIVVESTTIPVTTVTPDTVTLTSTEYATLTETETASTVTDTFSTTSTDYTTVTTTAFFTATQTSTTDIYTTVTTTILTVPSGTFYSAYDTLNGYPAAQKAKRGSKCKGKSGNSSSSGSAVYSVAQYSASRNASTSASASAGVTLTTSSFEPEQTIYLPTGTTTTVDSLFPASVLCSATVTVSSTSTITATGEPLTITADADTTTTTVTSTITTTSTVVPDDVSTTLSFSTTSTLTETDSATATETTTSTNTNVATSTTSAYSICTGSANLVQSPFVDPASRTVEFYLFVSSSSYSIAQGDSTSQYTCCNSCASMGSSCGISYFIKSANVCYVIKPVASTGAQSNWHMTGYTRAVTSSGSNIGVTNGVGGYVIENYVG